MLKHWIIVGMLWCVSVMASAAAITVYPNRPATITLSNQDVNRIHCTSGDINDAFYSEEKGIILQNNGADSFVKFDVVVRGDKREYVSTRNELYITCNNEVYTLLVNPQPMPAQTVHLISRTKKTLEENISALNGIPEEDRAVNLSIAALKGKLAQQYGVKKRAAHKTAMVLGVRVKQVSGHHVLGSGLIVDEYQLTNETVDDQLLREPNFLRPEFGQSIYAVTLDPLILRQGEAGRLIIVRREVSHD